jgi:hypothetical protein
MAEESGRGQRADERPRSVRTAAWRRNGDEGRATGGRAGRVAEWSGKVRSRGSGVSADTSG